MESQSKISVKWPWIALAIVILLAAAYLFYVQYGPTPATDTTPATTSTTVAKPTTTLKIPEFGIQLALPAAISDAYYATAKGAFNDTIYANFSTHSLASAGGQYCTADTTAGAPLGSVAVTSTQPLANPTVENSPGAFVKQVGTKYIYYVGPQAACSDDKTVQAKASTDIAALQEALKTAALIQP